MKHKITFSNIFTCYLNNPETILDAALNSGFILPYGCKTGRCGTCKCKIVTGNTNQLYFETGLSEQEKNDGWVLSCARTAISDLTIESIILNDFDLPVPKILPCRIENLSLLSSDVIQIILRLPPNSEFSFIPGQYIEIIAPNGIRRSYSLANSDIENKRLEIHIRLVVNGVLSEYWFKQAKINDLLRLYGPLGTFFLHNTINKDIIFLATGTGIAPVKSMIQKILSRPMTSIPRSVSVFWGGRKPEDFYFDFAKISENIKFVPVLSKKNNYWSAAYGYVQDEVINLYPDLSDAVVYACGSYKMIQSAHKLLVQNGLPEHLFFSDAFVCSSADELG